MAISASFSLHQAEIADGLAEGFALFRIFRGGCQHMFRSADRGRTERESSGIQNVESHDVTAADFVEQVFFRYFAVLQKNGSSRTAVNAHLVLFVAGLESRERCARR